MPRFVCGKLIEPLLRCVEHGSDESPRQFFEFSVRLLSTPASTKLGLDTLRAALEEWAEGGQRGSTRTRLLTSQQVDRLREVTRAHASALSDRLADAVLAGLTAVHVPGAAPAAVSEAADVVVSALTALTALLPCMSSGEFLASRTVSAVLDVVTAAVAGAGDAERQRCGTAAVLLLVDVVRRRFVQPSDKALVIEMGMRMFAALQVCPQTADCRLRLLVVTAF